MKIYEIFSSQAKSVSSTHS